MRGNASGNWMFDFLCNESLQTSSTNSRRFVQQMKVEVAINNLMNVKCVTVMFSMGLPGLSNKEGY